MQKVLEKIKIFFTKKSPGGVKGVLCTPYRDWVVLFCTTILLLAIVFGVNAYLFFAIQDDSLLGQANRAKGNTAQYNHEMLDKILKGFLDREEQFEKIKINLPKANDPSL